MCDELAMNEFLSIICVHKARRFCDDDDDDGEMLFFFFLLGSVIDFYSMLCIKTSSKDCIDYSIRIEATCIYI